MKIKSRNFQYFNRPMDTNLTRTNCDSDEKTDFLSNLTGFQKTIGALLKIT